MSVVNALTEPNQLSKSPRLPISEIAPQNCEVHTTEIATVDSHQVVLANDLHLAYDYLIIATNNRVPADLVKKIDQSPPTTRSPSVEFDSIRNDSVDLSLLRDLCEQHYSSQTLTLLDDLDACHKSLFSYLELVQLRDSLDPQQELYQEYRQAAEEEIRNTTSALQLKIQQLHNTYLVSNSSYQGDIPPLLRQQIYRLIADFSVEASHSHIIELAEQLVLLREHLVQQLQEQISSLNKFVADRSCLDTLYFADSRLSFEASALAGSTSAIVIGDSLYAMQLALFISTTHAHIQVQLIMSHSAQFEQINADFPTVAFDLLQEHGILLTRNTHVQSIHSNGDMLVVSSENGEQYSGQRVYVTGSQPHTSFMKKNFYAAMRDDLTLVTNSFMQLATARHIFVLGDAAASDSQIRGCGAHDVFAAEVVANNLRVLMTDDNESTQRAAPVPNSQLVSLSAIVSSSSYLLPFGRNLALHVSSEGELSLEERPHTPLESLKEFVNPAFYSAQLAAEVAAKEEEKARRIREGKGFNEELLSRVYAKSSFHLLLLFNLFLSGSLTFSPIHIN